jgi:hypothetical protein
MTAGRVVRGRRGAMTVVAVVCVIVATTMMVVAVRRTLTESTAAQSDVRRSQCQWLVESGMDRAAARLAADPKYAGETWKIPAPAITGRGDQGPAGSGAGGASVKIEITAPAGPAGRRMVRVQADWPEDPSLRVRQTKEAAIQ